MAVEVYGNAYECMAMSDCNHIESYWDIHWTSQYTIVKQFDLLIIHEAGA